MISWRAASLGVLILVAPTVVSAQGLVQLVGIPTVGGSSDVVISDTQSYVNAIYNLSIAAAAFLAVVKIILAGVQYALSDIVTSKETAKKDIQGAILGLLIVLAAVLILREINPNLLNFNFLQNTPTPMGNSNSGGDASDSTEPGTIRIACDAIGPSGSVFNCDQAIARCNNKPGEQTHTIESERTVVCTTN